MIILNIETLSPEAELVQDLITMTRCFSAQLYGLRTSRKAREKAIRGEQNPQNPPASH